MAFDDSPIGFFGPSYSLTSNAVTLPTVSATDTTIDTFTSDGTTAVLTMAVVTAHNLKVGDLVALSSATTLPAPFTAADHYVVSVPAANTVTLSLTKGGTAIVATDTGTGAHTIKALGALQEVTATEAHATDGDWRKVAYGLCELMYQKTLNTATADRPSQVTISRSSSVNDTTGNITRYYSFQFVTEPTGVEVVDE